MARGAHMDGWGAMSTLDAFYGPNAGYALEIYERWL